MLGASSALVTILDDKNMEDKKMSAPDLFDFERISATFSTCPRKTAESKCAV